MDRMIAQYVAGLEEEVALVPDSQYFLHRGMLEALDAAAGRPGFAVGLGTGNVRAGARVKLTRVGVHDRFGFGGFGCDSKTAPPSSASERPAAPSSSAHLSPSAGW